MPSPIAHASVALVLWPVVRDGRQPVWRQLCLGGLVLVGVLGADLDIAVSAIATGDPFIGHGGAWHSLPAGVVFATVFVLLARYLTDRRALVLWLVGLTAWWSHVLLDAFTPGRGVAMFWPFSDERVSAPLTLFYGVRHSEPLAWHHHLVTVATELPFVCLMLLLGLWINRLMKRSANHPLPKPALDDWPR